MLHLLYWSANLALRCVLSMAIHQLELSHRVIQISGRFEALSDVPTSRLATERRGEPSAIRNRSEYFGRM